MARDIKTRKNARYEAADVRHTSVGILHRSPLHVRSIKFRRNSGKYSLFIGIYHLNMEPTTIDEFLTIKMTTFNTRMRAQIQMHTTVSVISYLIHVIL